MQYDILLTKVASNGYVARPIQWPEVVASGEDEAEALAAIRKVLAEFLDNSRIVQIELPTPTQSVEDPWLRFAGMWADIPDDQWERFQTAITEARQNYRLVFAASIKQIGQVSENLTDLASRTYSPVS